jgi:hypothetical protein
MHGQRLQAFQQLAGGVGMKLRVVGRHAQEEAIDRGVAKGLDLEQRMMRPRQPVSGGNLMKAYTLFAAALLSGARLAYADDPAPPLPKHRPLVAAVLSDGQRIEGLLERFDDCEYWLLVGGKRQTFAEKDLASIEFRMPAPDERPGEDPEIARLIDRFFRPTQDGSGGRQGVDPTLISDVAAAGPKAVRPLLAAFARKQDDYQAVGQVLKQMGPIVFPLLVESVREDPGRSARFPVWYALRESGVEHAPFVLGLLKDKDPRIRLLAMEVLYSWSITGGVTLPRTLDLPLIQILDDPDADVRHQAPLILGRIGFNSELVLPTLLRILNDDRYASVHSNTVIALGYLGRELKSTDSDLPRIVDALARALSDNANETVRSYSALYLGNMGPKAAAALPALQRAADDKKTHVRDAAEEALRKLREEHPRERSR